ncbi:winged helix-turn-helix transcriptional regulator [Acinetobacter ursingii]|uniref:winged helix-turn-helix transcriptional regulator n=1 Tax=Acinetobacter ursingii TaxID=108980 RepID=UPI004034DA90
MSECVPSNTPLTNTGFGYTLSLINGKYKMIIMYWLYEYKAVMRFNELQRSIGNISFRTLSNTLKEMERDHLISKHPANTALPSDPISLNLVPT